jgi:hypothetical protein
MKLLPILHAWYRGWEPPEADPYYRYNSRR